MDENTPLWMLAANAVLGLALIAWVAATLVPFLLGRDAALPGLETPFFLMCAWAGWNAHLILRSHQ